MTPTPTISRPDTDEVKAMAERLRRLTRGNLARDWEAERLAMNEAADLLDRLSAQAQGSGETSPCDEQDEILLAYGLLWVVTSTDKRVHAARRSLLECLTKDQQAKAIQAARDTLSLVRDIRQMKGATFAHNAFDNAATGGDGNCGCTERCKQPKNCQYDVVLEAVAECPPRAVFADPILHSDTKKG